MKSYICGSIVPFISPNGPTSLKISKTRPRGPREERQFWPPTGARRYKYWVVVRGGGTWVGPVLEHTLLDSGDSRCRSTRRVATNTVGNKELEQSVRFYSLIPLFEPEIRSQEGQKRLFFLKSPFLSFLENNLDGGILRAHMIRFEKRHYAGSSGLILNFCGLGAITLVSYWRKLKTQVASRNFSH